VSEDELAVGDDPAADPRAEREQHEIFRPAPGTEGVLGEGRALRVVCDVHGTRERRFQARAECDVGPVEVRRITDRTGRVVDVARRADPHAGRLGTGFIVQRGARNVRNGGHDRVR
jgi:hypothetical protein